MTQTLAENRLLHIIDQASLSGTERMIRQDAIYQHVLRNSHQIQTGNFSSVSPSDLGILFHAIDESFFGGLVGSICEKNSSRPLSFRLSTRMTNAGGMTTRQESHAKTPQVEYEIAIATTPLFETFRIRSHTHVGGMKCSSRLEALQRIMEHEMVHLLEMLLWTDSNCSAHRFRQIVKRFFGHTESNHRMLTPRDIAQKEMGISTGDIVSFTAHGQHQLGLVNRITKRATVLVNSPEGVLHTDGRRYQKFYVPLHRLKRA